MVVGDGMLATAFLQAGAENWPHIIFASGVSNSLETDPAEFLKEMNLLLSYKDTELTLIYFSTVSVFDLSLAKSPYILHKLEIEKLIEQNFKRYLILRLPIVVGKSSNPHTLTNFLYQSIVHERPFKVYQNATRYLLDLDDVVKLVTLLVRKSVSNLKLDLVLDNKMAVTAIIDIFVFLTGKKGIFELVPEGSDYEIDNIQAMDIIGKEHFHLNDLDYNLSLLRKYYGDADELH